eukprot:CAMPEP_0178436300 /NCGR_PEP_ID=MMETSP0689_2-20121128/34369_1 /TAXON_ID=160604 /ORGANISM="Amphidinium massartii, Strain CS-259" /LENGTH=35 /DNA_ID= /DNA_START= /DNA_END= /DNA_ORIENTATION=
MAPKPSMGRRLIQRLLSDQAPVPHRERSKADQGCE